MQKAIDIALSTMPRLKAQERKALALLIRNAKGLHARHVSIARAIIELTLYSKHHYTDAQYLALCYFVDRAYG